VRKTDGLQTNQSAKHVLTVTGSTEPLELTLVWTEPAGTVGAADPMINELAFDVIAPDGTPVDARPRPETFDDCGSSSPQWATGRSWCALSR